MTTTEPRTSTPALLPPQDLAAETLLLEAMLLQSSETDVIPDALEVVKADDFYSPANGTLFTAMAALWKAGKPVDILTVGAALTPSELHDIGGKEALEAMFFDARPIRSLAKSAAQTVADMAALRRLIAVCSDGLELAYTRQGDVTETVDRFQQQVFSMASTVQRGKAEYTTIGEDIAEHVDVLRERQRRASAGETVSGLSTGLRDLDPLIGGLMPGGVYVIGGAPGDGKSSLGLDIARFNCARGVATVGFNQEMTKAQVNDRFIAAEIGIPGSDLRDGKLSDRDIERVEELQVKAKDWPLSIVKQAKITPLEIRSALRRIGQKIGPPQLVFVDYLQLMKLGHKAQDRQNEVAELSSELKSIAMDFEIPLIVLAQLNRESNKDISRRPTMHDLKDSGAIESDAEAVMLLWRDELRNPASDKKGVAEVIIGKNRNGETGSCECAYLGRFTTFRDLPDGTAADGLSPAQRLAAASGTPDSRRNMGSDSTTDPHDVDF